MNKRNGMVVPKRAKCMYGSDIFFSFWCWFAFTCRVSVTSCCWCFLWVCLFWIERDRVHIEWWTKKMSVFKISARLSREIFFRTLVDWETCKSSEFRWEIRVSLVMIIEISLINSHHSITSFELQFCYWQKMKMIIRNCLDFFCSVYFETTRKQIYIDVVCDFHNVEQAPEKSNAETTTTVKK